MPTSAPTDERTYDKEIRIHSVVQIEVTSVVMTNVKDVTIPEYLMALSPLL